MKKPLSVGMSLWYVPSGRYSSGAREVIVTKIGRRWATVGEGWQAEKIDLETWCADGRQYSSPGVCYESKADYEYEVMLKERWDRVRIFIGRCYMLPEGFTLESIEALEVQFGIKPR